MRKLIAVGILLVACLPQFSHARNYLGCFEDKVEDRLLNGKVTVDEKMTVKMCVEMCIAEGDSYAALEDANTCYCGSEKKDHDMLTEIYCETECPGDSTYICGGDGVASVYFTHVCSLTKTSEDAIEDPCPELSSCNDTRVGGKGFCICPLGLSFCPLYIHCIKAYRTIACFEDKSDRMLKGTLTSGGMTRTKCIQTCIREGHSYAGVENADNCYCGDYLENYKRLRADECTLPCTGDPSEKCGAEMKIEIFATYVCEVTAEGDPCPSNAVCSNQTIGSRGVCECGFGYKFEEYVKHCEKVCQVRESGDSCPGESSCNVQFLGYSGVCKCTGGNIYDTFTDGCIDYKKGNTGKTNSQVGNSFEITVNADDREFVYSPHYIYAEKYSRLSSVAWLIDTDGHDLLLNFLEFNTESCCDWLKVIYKPGDQGYTFLSGAEEGKTTLQSEGSVRLKFRTDDALEKSGFLIQYIPLLKDRVIGLTGAEFNATTELKQVIIERVDDPWNQLFYFKIRAPENHHVRVTVTYMDMEPSVFCEEDYLKIFDGEEIDDKNILLHACRDRKFATKVEVSSVEETVTMEHSCRFSTQITHGKLCAVINYRAYVFEGTTLLNTSQIVYNMTLFQHEMLRLNTSYLVFKVDISDSPVMIGMYTFPDSGCADWFQFTFMKLFATQLQIRVQITRAGQTSKTIKPIQADNVLYGYKTFWLFIEGYYVRFGEGSNIGENQLGALYIPIVTDFTVFKVQSWLTGILYQEDSQHDQAKQKIDIQRKQRGVTGGGPSPPPLSTAENALIGSMEGRPVLTGLPCGVDTDECEFLDSKRTFENLTYGHIDHSIFNNSYEYKLWTIEKTDNETVNLKIEQSVLTKTPDCIYERVTIYRGYCPIKTNAITYFCGKTIELITQTHGRFTTIEYKNSFIPPEIFIDQDVTVSRAFRIRYEVIAPEKDVLVPDVTETEPEQGIPIVFLAAAAAVIIVVACIIIGVLWKKKKQARTARTAPIHPLGAQDTLQAQLLQQLMPNQGLVLNIHVGNQQAGGASKHNVHDEKPDPPGIPPPAVYVPPHSSHDEPPPAPYDMDSEY